SICLRRHVSCLITCRRWRDDLSSKARARFSVVGSQSQLLLVGQFLSPLLQSIRAFNTVSILSTSPFLIAPEFRFANVHWQFPPMANIPNLAFPTRPYCSCLLIQPNAISFYLG